MGGSVKSADLKLPHNSMRPVHEETASKVRLYIEANNYSPGDVLPAERLLAQEFQVSRHTLREALRVLEERGILISKRGSGTYIAPMSHAGLKQLLASCVATERDRLEEIFQFREILEPQVVALAAKMATPSHIDELESLIRQQAEATDIAQMREIDIQFHMALARATGNSILTEMVQGIHNTLGLVRSEHLISRRRQKISLAGHQMLIEAIRQRDPQMAIEAMRDHLQEIKGALLS